MTQNNNLSTEERLQHLEAWFLDLQNYYESLQDQIYELNYNLLQTLENYRPKLPGPSKRMLLKECIRGLNAYGYSPKEMENRVVHLHNLSSVRHFYNLLKEVRNETNPENNSQQPPKTKKDPSRNPLYSKSFNFSNFNQFSEGNDGIE